MALQSDLVIFEDILVRRISPDSNFSLLKAISPRRTSRKARDALILLTDQTRFKKKYEKEFNKYIISSFLGILLIFFKLFFSTENLDCCFSPIGIDFKPTRI